jgi:Abnormal spindle-like microcephaly-assoc'd, ASPM-SPD-2-Hydin/Right handed beta helix region
VKSRYPISFILLCAIGLCLCAPSARGNTLQVGPGKQYAAPCAAIAAAAAGDEIDIDSTGTYTGDVCQWSTAGLTLVGVGTGRAVINAGGNNSQGKGIWVISGNNTTVENIEFTGAAVPDMNGAGIRAEGNNLTIRNCYFHDNQEGILTDGGNSVILIEFSEFYHNGAGDGFSHNLYIGNITQFIFRYNYSHGAVIGHLLKSRAAENDIYYNRLTDEGTGTASYEIDLPNGGLSFVIGNLVEKGPQAQNNALVTYQEEGAASGNPDHELFVVNNTMVNDYGQGTFVVVDSSVQVPAIIKNNIFQGQGTITTQGSATQANNFAGNALLVSPSTYDYHLQSGSPAINAGAAPGQGAGVSLTPVWQYVHPSCAEGRVTTGSAIDIGAYEYNGGSGSPPPNAPSRCGTSGPPAPIATPSPTTLAFGNQVLNTSSASQPITLTNGGTASLSITSISASANFAQTNNCGSSLAAGANCAINVTFTPTALGALTGTISITDNATGSPQTVSLGGTGIAATPAASLAPTTLNFGNQTIGTASPAQTMKLTNGGGATLHISSVATSGDYSQTNNCGSSLAIGANCTINVTFNPSAAGSRTGTVSVTDDAAGSPQSATLSGTGVTTAPTAVLSPTSVTYPGQLVGTTGTAQTVTLTNSGNAVLSISSITATGDFLQTNNCGANLAAGGNCTINVSFKPSQGAARTGMLSVVDNAGGTPQSVALAGTGMDFTLAISPGTATLTAGQSVTVNVVVSPVGGLNQAVTLGCTGAPAAAACSVSPANLTLNGSGASTASVSLTTSARSLLPISFRSPRPPALPLMLIAVFIVMAMMVWKTRASRRLIQCFGFSVLVVLFTGGCAGVVAKNPSPSPGGGTPAGNYALNITATLSGIAHSATFTLNVQ